MALYEHLLIARQDISAQQVDALATHLKTIVEGEGGKVEKQEYWGLRGLAYRIKKNRKGHYVLLNINAPAGAVIELERQLKINEDVLRYLTVKVDEFDTTSSKNRRDDRADKPEGEAGDRGDRAMSFGGNREGGRGRDGDRERGEGRGGRDDGARRPFFRRKKTCPFSGDNAPKIDYKDVKLLQRFISERGKIVPSPHHRRQQQEAAHPGQRHQARPLHGAAALRREVGERPCK